MDLMLKNVRCSFIQDLFEPKQFQGKGAFRYSATFLIPHDSPQDKAILAAIKTEAENVYGKKAANNLAQWESNSNKYAYQTGDNSDYDGYEGNMVLSSHCKTAPKVIDRDKSVLTAQDGKPYAGCYVNASISIYAQKEPNPGIRCSFNGVQFAADGDAFAGSKPVDLNNFDDLSEGAGEDDLA